MNRMLGGNMGSNRSFLMMAIAFLAASSLLAQGNQLAEKPELQQMIAEQADRDRRAEIAEELIQSRESQDHALNDELRWHLMEVLTKESVEQLELRRASGDLLIAPTALGDRTADLSYTTFQQPCRILDTRLAGGKLTSGDSRYFQVVGDNLAFQGGNPGGCGVPVGATAALINFVAVSAEAAGNLKGAAYLNTIPATGSILNYQMLTPALNIANGVLFPICDAYSNPFDCPQPAITLQANGGSTHVVADVLGYAMQFPREQVKDFVVEHYNFGTTSFVPSICINYANNNGTQGILTLYAPVAGKVVVRATVQLKVYRTTEGLCSDAPRAFAVYLSRRSSPTTPDCSDTNHRVQILASGLKCGLYSKVIIPLDGVFPVTANTVIYLAIDGLETPNADADSAQFWFSNMTAQFIPD